MVDKLKKNVTKLKYFKIAIKDLIHLFAVNAKTFDYEAFMTKTEVEDLPVAGV
jgi:hypothetical protein